MAKHYYARIVITEITPEERIPARYSGQNDTVTPESGRVLLNATFDTDTLNDAIIRVAHVLGAELVPTGVLTTKGSPSTLKVTP